MSLYDGVRTFFLLGGWLGSLVFVVYYHGTAKWYKDPLGRYLMSGPLGLFCLYTAAMANMFITTGLVRESLRMMMIVLAFSFGWYSVVVYHRMRIRKRKEGKANGDQGRDSLGS